MLAYLVTHALRTVRLWILLGKAISFGRVFAINTIGFLAINVIPLRLGEMVRPYLLVERESYSLGEAIAAILMERLLDVLLLLVMLLTLTMWIDLPNGGIQIQGVDVITVAQRGSGILLCAGTLAGFAGVIWAEKLAKLFSHFPKGDLIQGFVLRFRTGLHRLFAQPKQAFLLLFLSTAIWATTTSAVAFAMMAFEGLPVSIATAWSTWTITLCGMVAVPTPGFFGIFELSCAAALWIWGVDQNLATTFAVALHVGQMCFTLVMGGLFLFLEGLSLRTLVQTVPESKPQPIDHHS